MNLLFITQVYPPDPAAVGQYFEDAALELTRRGHRVLVFTADRDYDNPRIRYDSKSLNPMIDLVRLPFSSFGKKTIVHRLVSQASFLGQCFVRVLFCRRINGVVLTTIPATTGVFFLIAQVFRKFRYVYWVMDINPDQAIALGIFSKDSIPARLLTWVNNRLARNAKKVVCLDLDMAARLNGDIKIIPPWPMTENLKIVQKVKNPFVIEHNLQSDFVFMHSGNHSLVHPLDTLLDAIRSFDGPDSVKFVFIGGGRGKKLVEQAAAKSLSTRIVSLPYQPLEKIKYSLSAADIQIVSFGNSMVGIVHPCKLYNAMALGKPILFLGPNDSALGQIVEKNKIGWCVAHGAGNEMRRVLQDILATPKDVLLQMGSMAAMLVEAQYSREHLCGAFCTLLEDSLGTNCTQISAP